MEKKYEKPVKIDASFEQLVKESVSDNPAPKPKKEVTHQEKVNAAMKLAKVVKKLRTTKIKKPESNPRFDKSVTL